MARLSEDRAVELLLQAAREAGAAECEAIVRRTRRLTIKTFEEQVEDFISAEAGGVGLRAIVDGREGYAYTEDLSPERLARVARDAVENARVAVAPEPAAFGDFEAEEAPALDLWTKDLERVPMEEKVRRALDVEDGALGYDPRVERAPQNGYYEYEAHVRVASSRGLDRAYRAAELGAYSYALAAGEGDEKKDGYETWQGRSFAALDAVGVGRRAAAKAVAKLGAREVESGNYPVVFENEAMSDLLHTFQPVFSGLEAQEGKSLLQGRVGEAVAAEGISIVDDPLLACGFASRPFDDEGCPSRRTAVVERGTFRTFLHNSKTARRAGVRPTGHAARDVKGTLRVSASNFFLAPGDADPASFLARKGRVVKVVDLTGFHAGAKPVSGDFSLPGQGFLYEGGRLVAPIHKFTVSGNFFELLQGIEGLGRDLYFNSGACGAPTVLCSSLTVAGR